MTKLPVLSDEKHIDYYHKWLSMLGTDFKNCCFYQTNHIKLNDLQKLDRMLDDKYQVHCTITNPFNAYVYLYEDRSGNLELLEVMEHCYKHNKSLILHVIKLGSEHKIPVLAIVDLHTKK